MFKRHTHKWQEVNRTHTPRASYVKSIERASEELLEEIIFGITNIELKCSECGDIAFRSVTGKA